MKTLIIPRVLAPGLGNHLFQLSFAFYLSELLPNSTIYHFGIPELGIPQHPDYPEVSLREVDFSISGQDDGMLALLNSSINATGGVVSTTGLGMSTKYFQGSKDYLKSLISSKPLESESECNIDYKRNFLCHIRGSDIWERYPMSTPEKRVSKHLNFRKHPVHPNYSALPLSLYENIANSNGKSPIFLVERANPTWYLKLISKRFGKKSILFSGTVERDFSLLRTSSEVVLGISTFSWMAAFLGGAEIIHMPIRGLFDPNERTDLDLAIPERDVKEYRLSNHNWRGNKTDSFWIKNGDTQSVN